MSATKWLALIGLRPAAQGAKTINLESVDVMHLQMSTNATRNKVRHCLLSPSGSALERPHPLTTRTSDNPSETLPTAAQRLPGLAAAAAAAI